MKKRGNVIAIMLLIIIIIVLSIMMVMQYRQNSEQQLDTPSIHTDVTANEESYEKSDWEYFNDMQQEEIPSVFERAEWDRPEEQITVTDAATLNNNGSTSNSAYEQYLEITSTDEENEEVVGQEHTALGITFLPCDYYVIATAVVNTRIEPSTNAGLGDVKLKPQQEVHVIAESDRWLQIELEQNTYYIRRDTVRNAGGQNVQG